MLVKLTYYGTGKPTLVNLSKIETIYQVYDKYKERVSTKIQFQGGGFINVEEDLQTILKIQWDFNGGITKILIGNPQPSMKWLSPLMRKLVNTSTLTNEKLEIPSTTIDVVFHNQLTLTEMWGFFI